MEYLNVLIGNKEMYIPVNDKLGKTMLLAHKRLNYEKYIARMRHFGNGKMVAERAVSYTHLTLPTILRV